MHYGENQGEYMRSGASRGLVRDPTLTEGGGEEDSASLLLSHRSPGMVSIQPPAPPPPPPGVPGALLCHISRCPDN
jgi:hypothetical protein